MVPLFLPEREYRGGIGSPSAACPVIVHGKRAVKEWGGTGENAGLACSAQEIRLSFPESFAGICLLLFLNSLPSLFPPQSV